VTGWGLTVYREFEWWLSFVRLKFVSLKVSLGIDYQVSWYRHLF